MRRNGCFAFTASLPLEPEETDARKPGLLVIRSAPMQRLLVLLRVCDDISLGAAGGSRGSGRNFLTHVLHTMSPRADKPLWEISSLVRRCQALVRRSGAAQDGTLLITDLERLDGYGQRDLLLLLTQLGQRPQSASVRRRSQSRDGAATKGRLVARCTIDWRFCGWMFRR